MVFCAYSFIVWHILTDRLRLGHGVLCLQFYCLAYLIGKPFTRVMAMNIHPKNKDALSGNLLVGGNSPDALTIGGTRCARYIRLGYSVRPLAAF